MNPNEPQAWGIVHMNPVLSINTLVCPCVPDSLSQLCRTNRGDARGSSLGRSLHELALKEEKTVRLE